VSQTLKKRIHAYYIVGEDPAQSDPNLPEIRETLSKNRFCRRPGYFPQQNV
jgi:predicted molibdopterin-dependent oxidoreductase YjgC